MKKILSTICLYIFIIQQTYAQHWQLLKSKELEGGFTASEITAHKGILYAIKGNTIYTSKDKGKHWTYLENNLSSDAFDTYYYPDNIMLISDGKNLYASTAFRYGAVIKPAVYKSSDDGHHWKKVFEGNLSGIAGGKIFAVGRELIDNDQWNFKNVLFYSSDGEKWIKSFYIGDYNTSFGTKGFPLCFSNHSHDILISNDGITADTLRTLHSTNGNYHYKIGNYIFISDSWIADNNQWYLDLHRINLQNKEDIEITKVIYDTDTIRSFAIADPFIFATTRTNSFYKIWRTKDNGDTWETIFTGDKNEYTNFKWPFNDKTIYVDKELISVNQAFSKDNGQTWEHRRNGITGEKKVYSIGSNIVTFNNENKVIISKNGGFSWEKISFENAEYNRCGPIITTQYDKIFIEINSGDLNKIYKSTDFGISWQKIYEYVPYHQEEKPYGTASSSLSLKEIIEAKNHIIMRMESSYYDGHDYQNYQKLYYKSSDGGQSWTGLTVPENNIEDPYPLERPNYVSFVSNGNILMGKKGSDYYHEELSCEMIVSENVGNSWEKHSITDSLIGPAFNNCYYTNAITDGKNIYIQTSKGYDSTFSFYLLTEDQKLEKLNWEGIESKPDWKVFTNIDDKLFILKNNRIYVSENKGQSWTEFEKDGLPTSVNINSIQGIDAALYLGTDYGIWKYATPENIITNAKTAEEIKNTRVYPNPATDFISFEEINNYQQVRLLSSMGTVIKSLDVNNQSNGQMNISDVEEGVYFVTFISDQQTHTEKILIK